MDVKKRDEIKEKIDRFIDTCNEEDLKFFEYTIDYMFLRTVEVKNEKKGK